MMKPGDKIRVPYGNQRLEATVNYVSGDRVGVSIHFADSDESTPSLFRLNELEGYQ